MACGTRVSPDVVQPGTYEVQVETQQEQESKVSERPINFFIHSSRFLLLVS